MGRRVNCPKNNKKGFAFALTIVLVMVLFILGIAIVDMGTNESKITAVQYNRTQSYYSARSGVEVALMKLQQEIDTGLYDEVNDLYAAVNVAFSGSITPGKDTFNVTFVDGGLTAQDKFKILAQSTNSGAIASTALTIHFLTPDYLPLDWLNPGQIMRKGFFERSYGPVVVKTAKLLGHAPKKSATATTIWKAPEIHFIDDDGGFSFEVTAKSIEFQTNLLSFKKKIYTSSKSEDSFMLSTFDSAGFVDEDGDALLLDFNGNYIPDHWGVLALKEDMVYGTNKNSLLYEALDAGYYAYAPGLVLSDETQRVDENLIKEIIYTDTIEYIDEIIRKSTSLELNPTEMQWSKN